MVDIKASHRPSSTNVPPSAYRPPRKRLHRGWVASKYSGTWEELTRASTKSSLEEKRSIRMGASRGLGHSRISATVSLHDEVEGTHTSAIRNNHA